MEPIKLKPIYKEKIWGSDCLRRLLQKDTPADKLIGESWELVDFPSDCNLAVNSPYKGKSLREILDESGSQLGFKREQLAEPFALLIKFLDAGEDLSIQVHPDAAACEIFPAAQLKTECWLVLATGPGGRIYRGLKPGIGKEQVKTALLNGVVDQLLEVYPARPGDFYFLPAGTVHALGSGVLVAEIQTPSDTTFRIFDWNRRDAAGKARELHIEQALRSSHFTDGTAREEKLDDFAFSEDQRNLHRIAAKLGPSTTLVDCEFFSVVRTNLNVGLIEGFTSQCPAIMIALSGRGKIAVNPSSYPPTPYVAGDTIILPKMDGARLEIDQPGQWLLTCLGPTKP